MSRPTVLLLGALALPCAMLAQEVDTRTVNNGNVVLEQVPEVPVSLVEQLNRYQAVRSAGFNDWTADGQGIFITTRFGDVSQVHRVDMPGGARQQLTFFREPAGGVSQRPGRTEFSYRMDKGGSEFYQLFLYDLETGDHRRLTDGESRNGAALWSRDGTRLAYQSTRRNGSSNDVWLMDPDDPGGAWLALESPDGTWWGPADWSPDNSQLVIMNYVSVTDSRLHLLDVQTGELSHLAGGGDEPASYSGITPTFSGDGSGIFLATDAGGNFRRLMYQDLESGERRVITADISWDVEGFALSDDGTRAAFSVNHGGRSYLYLLDPESLAFEPVQGLPSGGVFGLEFSPDGSRLAMTLNTPKTPSDVFTLDMETRALTRWTYSEVGGLNTDRFVEPELVEFESFDGRMIPAFVYRPNGAGPHPVIVSIHGGPEGQYRPFFSSTYQMWVNEVEAAVIAPNVRGSAGSGRENVMLDNGMKREDSVKDIGALLDWIASQPDLDENRVAVYGGSYGGYMVLASAVHYSDRLTAAVDIVGISNFVTFLENTQSYRRDLRRPEYGDERDPEMRAFLETISPNNHSDKITIPLFVAQGENDPRVPVTESEQIVAAVRATGHDVWYMNALNEGHGFRKKENRDLFSQITVMFLQQYLVGAQVSVTP
jgi:dipeptidyl aminopeptidase/acylaminoacyl peptidase